MDAFLEDIKSPLDLIFGGTWPDGSSVSSGIMRDEQ